MSADGASMTRAHRLGHVLGRLAMLALVMLAAAMAVGVVAVLASLG